MSVCLLCIVCCQRSLRRAEHSSRGVLPRALCPLSVIEELHRGGLGSLGLRKSEDTNACFRYAVLLLHLQNVRSLRQYWNLTNSILKLAVKETELSVVC